MGPPSAVQDVFHPLDKSMCWRDGMRSVDPAEGQS